MQIEIFQNELWSVRTHLYQNVPYFCAKDVAKALGYKNPREAVRDHVFEEDRSKLEDLRDVSPRSPLPKNTQGHSVYITEAGVYALIFGSQKEEAKRFKKWVCQVVLPKLRKCLQEQRCEPLCLRNETQLHHKVVQAIRRFYPQVILIPGLGELQDTQYKRIDAFRKGYQKGQPDILILNEHKTYRGLAIELKTPMGTGSVSQSQSNSLFNLQAAGFKTLLSDDYDRILLDLFEYFREIRIRCPHCCKKFKNNDTLNKHTENFHRIHKQAT